MRHADQPVVTESVQIAAPPEVVWPFISDIAFVVAPSPELQAVEWLDGTGDLPCVGRRFRGTNRNRHFGEWQTTSTITECDAPTAFGWVVGDVDEPMTRWRFSAESDGAGCVLSQRFQLGLGESGISVAIARMPDKEEAIIARRLSEFSTTMRANLDAIKAAAERA